MEASGFDQPSEIFKSPKWLPRITAVRLLEVVATLFVVFLAINYMAGIIWSESALGRAIQEAAMEHRNAVFTPDLHKGFFGGDVRVRCEMRNGTVYTVIYRKLFYLLPEQREVTTSHTLQH